MRILPSNCLAFTLLVTMPSAVTAQSSDNAPAASGRWGVEFLGLIGGPQGGSAMFFTSPTTAWRIAATVEASGADQGSLYYRQHEYYFDIGRRWYRKRDGRVQPFTGLGIAGLHTWSDDGLNPTYEYGQVGVYGELGAQILVAEEIAIGSRWRADVLYDERSVTGSSWEHIHILAGGIDVFAMFRF
jgi:hypothetical protein